MWTGQRPTVIIGDPQAACDLLDKRSAIYSSRPRFVVMGTYRIMHPLHRVLGLAHMQAAELAIDVAIRWLWIGC